MTMRIEVTIPEDDIKAGAAAQYLERSMAAVGFSRGVSLPLPKAEAPAPAATPQPAPEVAEEPAQQATEEDHIETVTIRYHGQPSEGRKRRTKEEIALDDEAEKLLEAVGLSVAKLNGALDKAAGDWDVVMADLRAAADTKTEEPKANISTGEERADPAEESSDEPLTHDDVRNALGDYAAKFGMPAAQKNGPKFMGADKISAIPDDQDALRKAVDAIRAEIAEGA